WRCTTPLASTRITFPTAAVNKDDLPDYTQQQQRQQQQQREARTRPGEIIPAPLLASCCASPAPAHSVLLEFNLRWNLRMMVKDRGLPAALTGHCNEYLVELV
ncbi:unnamed protein product, partial [Ectocarpus fasciculatus]